MTEKFTIKIHLLMNDIQMARCPIILQYRFITKSWEYWELLWNMRFLSNKNDVSKFLKTEANLKSLAVADAKGIAEFLDVEKEGTTPKPHTSPVIEEGVYTIKAAGKHNLSIDIVGASKLI